MHCCGTLYTLKSCTLIPPETTWLSGPMWGRIKISGTFPKQIQCHRTHARRPSALQKVACCWSLSLGGRYRDNGYVPVFLALPWRQERFAYWRVT